jgi:hypothetical protein
MFKQLSAALALIALVGCAGPSFRSADPVPTIIDDDEPTSGTGGTSNGTGGSSSGSGGTSSAGTGGTATAGTGGSSGSASDIPKCIPGEQRACECLTSEQRLDGQLLCNTSGAFDACKCVQPSEPSGTGGTGGTSNGTGGSSSGSGGTSSAGTGGSSSGSGGTSTAGTSGTGGTSSGSNFQDCTWTITSPNTAFSDSFEVTVLQDGGVQEPADCTGSGTVRTCTMTVDRSIGTEFWAYTGLADPAVYAPGWVGTASNVLAIVKISGTCTGNENPVPVRITNSHFRFEPKGSNVLEEDWDHDKVATANDCDDHNPSIGSCTSSPTSGMTTVAFYAIGGGTSGTLQIIPTNGSSVVCQSVNTTDPANSNTSTLAVRCFIDIDLTQEFAFNIQAGSFYAAASPSPGICQKYFRIYAYAENVTALADFDDTSVTNFNNTQMFIRPRGDNCDVVLPKK